MIVTTSRRGTDSTFLRRLVRRRSRPVPVPVPWADYKHPSAMFGDKTRVPGRPPWSPFVTDVTENVVGPCDRITYADKYNFSCTKNRADGYATRWPYDVMSTLRRSRRPDSKRCVSSVPPQLSHQPVGEGGRPYGPKTRSLDGSMLLAVDVIKKVPLVRLSPNSTFGSSLTIRTTFDS